MSSFTFVEIAGGRDLATSYRYVTVEKQKRRVPDSRGGRRRHEDTMGLFRKKKHQAISLPVGAAPVPASVKFRGCTYPHARPLGDHQATAGRQGLRALGAGLLPADPEARHDRAGRRRQLGGLRPARGAKKVGSTGRVIAIEMSPGNGRVILESARTNAIDNVRLILVGVSDTLETAFLRRQTMHNNHQLGTGGPGRARRPERLRLRPGRCRSTCCAASWARST
jgi:hypothetical protein